MKNSKFSEAQTAFGRKQFRNGMLSPVELERQQTLKAESVQELRGY